MRVSKKLMNKVIENVAGKEGVLAANHLILKGEIAEEDLAKKLKQELKHTRNTLYKLQKHNLVKFKRKRNDENGWYTYYWSFNKKRVSYLSDKLLMAKIERLNYRLKVEEGTQFFACKNTCMRIDFEKVVELNYLCPECGCTLDQEDNKKKIREIKSNIKEIKEGIKDKSLLK